MNWDSIEDFGFCFNWFGKMSDSKDLIQFLTKHTSV